MLDLVEGILLTYNNLLGLLDYGEKDALTELLNRKTFDGAFFKATAEQHGDELPDGGERRHPHPDAGVWLAVLDIDHFKRVNDTYGHLIGDEVLLLLARLMRSSFRFHDQLYRFGGEEFVVLMRCDSVEHAHAALERLRERVQAYAFPQVGTITVSIGFSVLLPHDTPSGAFGRADKAVYHAKEHGRNQVCSYQALVAAGELVDQVSEGMDVDLF
jgi:diguanylate cyclase (GGDEF)-like protein